jgi:hypothetical protein
MIKNWSNTLIVAYSHLPKIVNSIDFRVENCVNSGFKSVHLLHGITNEQLYEKMVKLIVEKRKMVNLYHIVNEGLDAIPDSHRLLIELHCFKGKTFGEISAIHGVPMRTLFRRFDDALLRFKKAITKLGFDEEYLENDYSSYGYMRKFYNSLDTENYSPSYNTTEYTH